MDLFTDLSFRGQVYQETDSEGLRAHLAEPRQLYCGFDPTSDSLTIGNLVAILLLRRFQLAGHEPYVLMGGGTGLIGDPSGKEVERQIQSPERVQANVDGQRPIFERLLDFSGPRGAKLVNNADWLTKLGYIEVLRDVGKHFSINAMIQRDSVRDRLGREQGISYTEFSYMLLQAYDFLHLHDRHGVTLQVAGSDQWGNVVSGIDLIRRTRQKQTFGLTAPLITKADGGKFGKTESGAIWLSADRTSPYAFYQFWINASDADVSKFLRTFSFFPHEQIEALEKSALEAPAERAAQRALAAHMTELLHGREGLESAEACTQALFSGQVAGLSAAAIAELFAGAPSATLPKQRLEGEGYPAVELLVDAAVVKSKREAREFLANGAILINGHSATPEAKLTAEALLHREVLLIRRGKKAWHVARFA